MPTDLRIQIDRLEKACNVALRNGDDAETLALLAQTLNVISFNFSDEERSVTKGLANMASAHADMLLNSLTASAPPAVAHNGLARLCNTLAELRESLDSETKVSQRDA